MTNLEHLCGCQLQEQLHARPGVVVIRGCRIDDGLPVVLKAIEDNPASPGRLSALRHEYAILRDLDGEGAPRAHGLVHDQGRWGLLLDDIGGRSLAEQRLGGSLALEELLELAIAITRAIQVIHGHRVVHKDINPSNLIWNPAERRLVLIDFGIATVFPRETIAFTSPSEVEGTLAYISPEQTGRMNRAVDYRTDYYSLGVMLYELATGRLPFDARDPLDLVHSHIARQPPSLGDLNPSIPQPVTDIVRKLMAKSADDRYQSTHGILADLLRCLDELKREGGVTRFAVGQADRAEHFGLPQKLYGREQEIERILDAFERASAGAATLVMVSGYPGVGKSALIREVYRPLTMQRGYFIAGKFDQYQNVPHAALIQALRGLIGQVLTESQESIASWRPQLLDALLGSVQILIDVCPDLALVTGQQPPPDTLPPVDTRARFQHAVCALFSVFATAEHPLCVFLDDLQWADADTLALLEELMHAARTLPLLIIGAYRDSEVGAAHPLALTLEQIEAQGGHVERLAVAPLGLEHVTELVADTLSMSAETVAPLAELVCGRTAGNPFFLHAFLTALHDDGLLVRTPTGWSWELEDIRRRGVTDNVVTLMVDRIQRLPQATQEVLVLAACLGNEFDLGTLAMAADREDEGIIRDLWPAATEELVLVLDRVHSVVDMLAAGPGVRCRFAHDRIRQAVVSMIDGDDLAGLHLDVGRRLLARLGPEARKQRLFEVVSHLNKGRVSISDASERDDLARMNLQAAYRALKGAAAQPALSYAHTGLSLVGEDGWNSSYELVRDLHIKAVEAAFLGGELEVLEELASAVLAHARTLMDQVAVWKLQGQVHYAQQRLQDALDAYQRALDQMGFALPAELTATQREDAMRVTAEMLGRHRAIEELVDLPECKDPVARVAMELLEQVIAMTYTSNSDLLPVAICRLVQLSLTHGNTPHSALGYVFYGILLSYQYDLDRAHSLGLAAVQLADRFGDKSILSRSYLARSGQLAHWKEPLYQISPALLLGYRHGIEAGSRFFAANSATTMCINRFLAGDELGEVVADMERYAEVIAQLRQPMVLSWHRIYTQAAVNLHRKATRPWTLAGPIYDEDGRVPGFRAANDHAALFNHYYCRSLLCYLFGEFENAAASAEANEAHQAIMATSLWAGPWTFLHSLCRLSVYEHADEEARARIRDVVTRNQAKLAQWLPHCPASFAHKLRLVEAELARVLGHREEAAVAFDAAVELAAASGYVHEAAMACELAGRFYLRTGESERARDLLREAHRGYMRWGATTKVDALERQYPRLLPRVATSAFDTLTRSTISTRDWDLNVLDLIGVLNASQVISREIERDRLLTRLMELVIELAGAEVGYLLLERDDDWVVEVEKTVHGEIATILQSIPMDLLEARGHRGLPTAIVRYVARTQDNVVLDNATEDPQFGRDPHIMHHRVKSALCFPLARQGGQRGILYLENNLVAGAFPPARIQVLQLLSTQAVISLENAMLYDTLEQKVVDRTRELAEKNNELAATLARLRETQDRLIVQERLASLGALTAGIAHELRNPLNFVNNFAKLSTKHLGALETYLGALAERLDPEHNEHVESRLRNLELNLSKIVEHSQRIDGIIRAMLGHSRGGAGERVSADLNALILDCVKLARHGLPARAAALDIIIETDLDDSLGPVMMTPQEIGRVIINLLDNACYALMAKNTERAADFEPRIQVRTRALGDDAEIRVHDNGTGIPQAIRSRILDPFFTTKDTGE